MKWKLPAWFFFFWVYAQNVCFTFLIVRYYQANQLTCNFQQLLFLPWKYIRCTHLTFRLLPLEVVSPWPIIGSPTASITYKLVIFRVTMVNHGSEWFPNNSNLLQPQRSLKKFWLELHQWMCSNCTVNCPTAEQSRQPGACQSTVKWLWSKLNSVLYISSQSHGNTWYF